MRFAGLVGIDAEQMAFRHGADGVARDLIHIALETAADLVEIGEGAIAMRRVLADANPQALHLRPRTRMTKNKRGGENEMDEFAGHDGFLLINEADRIIT
jgi:hypothetical protein